jgi:5'-3' exonuclease
VYYTHPEFKDMFPRDFEIELDGCHNDYEGIVLLPPIRADAIRRAVGETEGSWTEAERRRNTHTW